MSRWLLLLSSVLVPFMAGAAIETQTVEYQHGETRLVGYLAYPKEAKGSLPGVLVVHEWMGLNDYAKRRAEQLAELGLSPIFETSHRENRVVAIAAERMLEGVADVERYPEFVPLLQQATIVRRSARAYEAGQGWRRPSAP